MDRAQVHFEMFVRRHGRAPWALALATEDRREAFEAVDAVLAEAADAAVRLCKETRDPATGDFRSLTLLERGVRPEPRRWRARRGAMAAQTPPAAAPVCMQPEDLYTGLARATIGRLLAGWLARNRTTPFELLHRAELAERLEACEAEMSAAIYNAASAQAAGREGALEPLRAALTALVRRTIERVVADNGTGSYRLGVVVAERLASCENWADKAQTLLDLLDAAQRTDSGEAPTILRLLQQPLADILGAHGESETILGEGLALGDRLLMLLQIAAAPEVAEDPNLVNRLPRLRGLAARLALGLHRRPAFARTRSVLVRRVVTVLAGATPLWPEDPAREAEGLALLNALFNAGCRLADRDQARAALSERWRRLAEPARIEARLAQCAGELEAADVLVSLAKAAVGRGSAEAFGRRLLTLLADADFAREACFSPDPPAVALKRLADLAAGIWALELTPEFGAIAAQRVRRLAAAIALPAVRRLGETPSHEMVRLAPAGGDEAWARPNLRLISNS
jgi:hypothetical protein